MAQPHKRITRKDLRRPDQFVTLTGTLLHYARQHRLAVSAAAALVVVVAALAWGWSYYRQRQHLLAGQEYARAVALYHAGKYRDSLAALDPVVQRRSSSYSRLALLYQANSYIALKEHAKGVSTLQEFLARERREPALRQLGSLNLGYAQERLGQWREAAMSFAEAQKLAGPYKEEALLAKARCEGQSGNLKESLKSYQEYLSTYPNSETASEVSLRIQELQSKAG